MLALNRPTRFTARAATPIVKCLSWACLLAVGLTAATAHAQTMRVSGASNTKEMFIGPCAPLPPPSAATKTPQQRAKAEPNRAAKVAPQPLPLLTPVATTTWRMLTSSSLEYCVNAGVVNDGAGSSGAPLTLTLSDVRGSKDASYTAEYPLASRKHDSDTTRATTTDGPPNHTQIPDKVGVISQPISAHSSAATGQPWCTTLTDWRKRPRLLLILTGGGSTQPVMCKVEFAERLGGGSPGGAPKE